MSQRSRTDPCGGCRATGIPTASVPAYLIVSDPHLSLQSIVQHYVRRWEIEVNFRDEKTLLGVGEAQACAISAAFPPRATPTRSPRNSSTRSPKALLYASR